MDRDDAIALQRMLAAIIKVLDMVRQAVITYARYVEKKHSLPPICTKQ